MMSARLAGPAFRKGDEVVLANGTYQGTLGVFLRLRDDVNWADISERNGTVRSHPVMWLAHSASAIPSEITRVLGKSFLRVPYVSVSARPRHLQRGMLFSG